MNFVILSRNPALYSTQSILRAGRRKGHFVRVIDHVQCDMVIEKNKPAIYYGSEKIRHIDAIIPRIGASVTFTGANIIRQFEMMQVPTVTKAEALLKSRDKITSLQILSSNGIDVPKSVLIHNNFNMDFMLNHISSYPAIVKLTNSTHGLGVLLAQDKKTAESMIEAFGKVKQKSLLQEFISESRGQDIRVFIVDGKIVASMKRQALGDEFRSNLHRGGSAEIEELSSYEEEIATKAAKVLGLSVAGVDILRSKRGPLVLEVNASPGLEGIETTTGIDIAGSIIEFTERKVRNKWGNSRK